VYQIVEGRYSLGFEPLSVTCQYWRARLRVTKCLDRVSFLRAACQHAMARDGTELEMSRKTLVSFTDVPKIQTLTLLKSQKREDK